MSNIIYPGGCTLIPPSAACGVKFMDADAGASYANPAMANGASLPHTPAVAPVAYILGPSIPKWEHVKSLFPRIQLN